MFADPLKAALHLKAFPVYCPACGFKAIIDPPNEAAISAIVERSEEISWNDERRMLLRLDALVHRFPNSLHRDKVRVTTSKAGPNNQYYQVLDSRPVESQPIITRQVAPDPEFDAALDADPQLKEWMRHRSFLLYVRLNWLDKEADYSERYKMAELECPDCHRDHIAIDRKFFETLI